MLLSLIIACSNFDYAIVSPLEDVRPGDSEIEPEIEDFWATANENAPIDLRDIRDVLGAYPRSIDMLFDAALQRMDWGQGMTRCQIQLSFRDTPQDHPSMGDMPPLPTEPGQCVYHEFSNAPMGPDNWYVSGNLTGPDEIYLIGDDREIILHKVTANEDGRLRYEMAQCNQSLYPFEESFDLHIPVYEGEGDLEPIHIEDALYVGPDLNFLEPGIIPNDRIIRKSVENGLPLLWELLGEHPHHDGEPIPMRMEIELHNNMMSSNQGIENLRCLPQEFNSTHLSTDDLLQFRLNSDFGVGEYSTGLSLLSILDSPVFNDPWGHPIKARSIISIGGMLELIEPK